MANYTGYGQIGMPTAYAFGGGTIGGPNVWDFSSGRPQLSEAARLAGTVTLPAGALSRQEIRNRSDIQQAMVSGGPYVEAPTMYKLNEQGKYADPLTGRSMGTIAFNYSAGPWRNIKGEEMTTGGGYSPAIQASRARRGLKPEGPERGGYGGRQPSQGSTPPPAIPDRSLGMTAESPMAFTGFGRIVGESPYRTPTIPRFPYSNY